MKRFLVIPAFCLLAILCCATARAQTELIVYSNSEPEMLRLYTEEFRKLHPDINLKWVRDSAGPVLARLMAEKNSPRADVIFGLSLAATLTLGPQELLDPYTPAEHDALIPDMRDNSEHPTWIPMNAWGAALCVNQPELERLKLPQPESWADLTNPVYAGHIVMPSPVSSSTGYFIITTWLDTMGPEKAWDYMEKLDANLKMYIHSGCKPCQMAAQGEAAIGISSGSCALPMLKRRAPLKVMVPSEGTGWDMEVAALVKKNRPSDDPVLKASQKLLDFAASKTVGRLAAENGYIPARADCLTEETAAQQALFLPINIELAVTERESILSQWRQRFEQR